MFFFHRSKQCDVFCIQEPAEHVNSGEAWQPQHALTQRLDRGGLRSDTLSEMPGNSQLLQVWQVVQCSKEISVSFLCNLVIH